MARFRGGFRAAQRFGRRFRALVTGSDPEPGVGIGAMAIGSTFEVA